MDKRRNHAHTRKYVDIGLLSIIIIPIVIISAFNHPLGDDYWFSAMVREVGFTKAFGIIYDTVSPRYTVLSLMAVSPLVFGNFWLYKLIPVLYIPVFALCNRYLLKTVTRNLYQSDEIKPDIFFISIVFTITYLAVMPGIGEGLFWVSSLAGYQTALMGLMVFAALMIQWHYHKRRSAIKGIVTALCFVFVMGCNEIMAAFISFIVLMIIGYQVFNKKRVDTLSLVLLGFMIAIWAFILTAPSFSSRYGKSLPTGNMAMLPLLVKACLYTAYHIGKCLVNPFFWVAVILSAPMVVRLNRRARVNISGRSLILILLASVFIMIGIEYVAIILTETHVPPLRVTNMAVFFLLVAVLVIAICGIHLVSPFINPGFTRYRTLICVVLLIAGFFLKNNSSVAARELLSGEAYRYDKELKKRYQLLAECPTDTCTVPLLTNRPSTLRFSIFDNDHHIGEYFGKTVIYIR